MVVNIPIYSRDGSSMMVNFPKFKSKQATPSKSVKFAVNGVWFAVSAVEFAVSSVEFAVNGVAFAINGVNPCDGIKGRKGQ